MRGHLGQWELSQQVSREEAGAEVFVVTGKGQHRSPRAQDQGELELESSLVTPSRDGGHVCIKTL